MFKYVQDKENKVVIIVQEYVIWSIDYYLSINACDISSKGHVLCLPFRLNIFLKYDCLHSA